MRLALFLLVLVATMHFAANSFGIYDAQIAAGNVWIDNVFHAVVGLAFALLWVHLLKLERKSLTYMAVSTVGFVLALAIVWEVCELAFYVLLPGYATEFKIYSPTVWESGMDALSNLGGAAMLIIWKFLRK